MRRQPNDNPIITMKYQYHHTKKTSHATSCTTITNLSPSIKQPGQPFREDLARYPLLKRHLEQMSCPRVHFKIIIIDATICYIGSANLTGAGMGMKSPLRRNFEAGILTNEPVILNKAIEEFDKIWRGAECPRCQRKQFCPSPIT